MGHTPLVVMDGSKEAVCVNGREAHPPGRRGLPGRAWVLTVVRHALLAVVDCTREGVGVNCSEAHPLGRRGLHQGGGGC